MAFGWIRLRNGSRVCGEGGSPACPQRTPENDAALDQVLVEINEFVAGRLGAVGLAGQQLALARELDGNGNLIGVKMVRVGAGTLVVAASAAAAAITFGVVTATGTNGGHNAATSGNGSGTTAPSASTYRADLAAACRDATAKLKLIYQANTEATPVGELGDVLAEQFDQMSAATPPDELATNHEALLKATRDRVTVLRQIATSPNMSDTDVMAAMRAADGFAQQMNAEFRTLEVTECAT